MKVSKNALKILKKRYFAPGETWEQLCERVARKVAGDEPRSEDRGEWGKKYKDMMLNLDFLPNSPTLRNFGRNEGCGSACFVLPLEDSRRSIFKTLSDAVDVQAYGGGTGMSFPGCVPKVTISVQPEASLPDLFPSWKYSILPSVILSSRVEPARAQIWEYCGWTIRILKAFWLPRP